MTDFNLSLDDVCAYHPRAAAELKKLRESNAQRGARMQVLWEWMREVDRWDFLHCHPEAAHWFDDDGVPVK